jgi:hypothetical protein
MSAGFPWDNLVASGVGALVGAGAAYGYNWLLFRYRVRYDAYRRILGRLDRFTDSLTKVRTVAADVGAFLERADQTAKAIAEAKVAGTYERGPTISTEQYVEDFCAQTAKCYDTLRAHVEAAHSNAEAHQREFFAHVDLYSPLQKPYVEFSWEMLTLSSNCLGLVAALAVASITLKPFPLVDDAKSIRDAREELLSYLNDMGLWCDQLREMLRAVTFPKFRLRKQRVTKRVTGNPDERFLTYDGFKTAQELGWYDPKLDRRRKASTKQSPA